VKPFLFIGIRADDAAADDEFAAVLRCAALDERDLRRVRLERDGLDPGSLGSLGSLGLEDWSGVIVGGGPWNVSDPEAAKSAEQRRGEAQLRELALEVIDVDFPFLGACYGIGTLGVLRGGVVDRTWSEPIGATTITLTEEGRADALLGGLSPSFDAFLGHKEAVATLPRGAVRLASSATCPVQAFRIGERVYATQFHPELDAEGIVVRTEAYRDHGYFPPDQADELIRLARSAVVTEPPRILSRFVERFGRD
jgi:GMP synthase (glutamine-hydrolysing)